MAGLFVSKLCKQQEEIVRLKNWYRKNVSEPVSEKFDTGTDFRCQNVGISKIYNGYWYRVGTGTENFSFFWWYRNRYRKNLVPEKSLGTGIGQIWYRKKVSEPVSGKFGTGKKYRYRYRKYLVPEKSIGIGIVQYFGYRHTLVTAELQMLCDLRQVVLWLIWFESVL